MGRPRKPTKLKILQGNPGRRPINKNEPQPEAFTGEAPKNLSRAEKKIWEQCAPGLLEMGFLTTLDVLEFARYCQFQAQYEAAMKFLEENGLTYDYKGLACPFPQVSIAKTFGALARQISAKFGMTPADRSGLKCSKPKEKSAFDKFLEKKK